MKAMAKNTVSKSRVRRDNARALLDEVGAESMCADIVAGVGMTVIAKRAGVGLALLISWIAADEERSRLFREARTESAKTWDELAERGIAEAADPFELAQAKELAHHYRWRASKIAPRDYGDKLVVAADTTLTIHVDRGLGGIGGGIPQMVIDQAQAAALVPNLTAYPAHGAHDDEDDSA